MPSPNPTVERLATTSESVFVLDWSRFPDLPQSLHRFPGMLDWWRKVQLIRERDKSVLEGVLRALQVSPAKQIWVGQGDPLDKIGKSGDVFVQMDGNGNATGTFFMRGRDGWATNS